MHSRGEAVQRLQALSQEFFADTLHTLLPGMEFNREKSYCTHCVTSKTSTGDVCVHHNLVTGRGCWMHAMFFHCTHLRLGKLNVCS